MYEDLDLSPVSPNATREEVSAFSKSVADKMKQYEGNAAAQNALLEDVRVQLQIASERAFAPRERRPSGESLDKFVTDKGMGFLTRTVRSEFAGQPVEIDVPGLFDSAPVDNWHADLLRLSSSRAVARKILATGTSRSAPTPSHDKMILRHLAKCPAEHRAALEKSVSKAIADTASSGGEWIPDVYSAALYEEYYTPNGIATLLPMSEFNGGALVVPAITDVIRPYIKNKIASDDPAKYTASTPTSSSTTVEVSGLAARVIVDDAATEDAIFALIPEISRRMARAVNDGYEDCMVNGDSTAAHQDTGLASWNIRDRWGATGLGGSADHRRSFIGFRAMAEDRSLSVNQSSGMTIAKVMEELVGKLGERASGNLVIIVSPEVFFKKLMTDTNVLTVDKLGANATLLRGQLGAIFGIPIVMSRWIDCKLNASGIYDNSTKTKSGVLVVSRDEFTHYQRRGTTVELDRDITIGGYNLVSTLRRKMMTLSSSTSAVVAWGYGWTGVS